MQYSKFLIRKNLEFNFFHAWIRLSIVGTSCGWPWFYILSYPVDFQHCSLTLLLELLFAMHTESGSQPPNCLLRSERARKGLEIIKSSCNANLWEWLGSNIIAINFCVTQRGRRLLGRWWSCSMEPLPNLGLVWQMVPVAQLLASVDENNIQQ